MHPYRTPVEMPKVRWGVTWWKKLLVRIDHLITPQRWRRTVRMLDRCKSQVDSIRIHIEGVSFDLERMIEEQQAQADDLEEQGRILETFRE